MSSIYSRKLNSQKVDSAYLDAAFSVKETFSYFFLVTNDIIPLNVSENPRISTLLEAKPWKLYSISIAFIFYSLIPVKVVKTSHQIIVMHVKSCFSQTLARVYLLRMVDIIALK